MEKAPSPEGDQAQKERIESTGKPGETRLTAQASTG